MENLGRRREEASSVVHHLLTTLVGYAVKPKPAP